MSPMKDMATKQVLLELRKKINALIAGQQMDDPEAAAEGESSADEAMENTGDLPDAEGAPDEAAAVEDEPEEDELRKSMRDYMNPKPKERRPGTAMMIAMAEKKPMGNKGRFGKFPRKEAG